MIEIFLKEMTFFILCCSVIGIFIEMSSNGHFPSKWPSKVIVLKQQLWQQHSINSVTCSEQHKIWNIFFTSSTNLSFLLLNSSTKNIILMSLTARNIYLAHLYNFFLILCCSGQHKIEIYYSQEPKICIFC